MKAPSRFFLALLIPLALAAGRITGPQAPDPVPIPDPIFISISPNRVVLGGFDEIPLRYIRVFPIDYELKIRRTPRGGMWFDRAEVDSGFKGRIGGPFR